MPKLFSQQFRECADEGLTKGRIKKKITPAMLPFCPSKRAAFLKHIKETGETHFSFVKCGRFGGQCRSSHPKCRTLRGFPLDK